MKYYIGIDLGGTNIAVGIVNENFEIIFEGKVKTNCPRPAKEICKDMSDLVLRTINNAHIKKEDVCWIGIGSPGTVNRDTGIVEYANNLDFINEPVAQYVKNDTGIDTYIDNDANVAAYGEYIAGAAKGSKNAVCITLGTGVGAGIIIGGKLYSGSNYAGGELGHTVIEIDGASCTCGRKGCFEAYSSATGLVNMTIKAMENDKSSKLWSIKYKYSKISARSAFEAMRAGDKTGKEVVDKYIKYLACGITNVINSFQPEVLCIGGGVCNEGDALLAPLKEIVSKDVYSRNSTKNTKIVIASLGNSAGIIGAAMLGTNIDRS